MCIEVVVDIILVDGRGRAAECTAKEMTCIVCSTGFSSSSSKTVNKRGEDSSGLRRVTLIHLAPEPFRVLGWCTNLRILLDW